MKTKTKRLLRTGDERAVTQTESVPRFAPVRSLLELLTLPQLATVWLSTGAMLSPRGKPEAGAEGEATPEANINSEL